MRDVTRAQTNSIFCSSRVNTNNFYHWDATGCGLTTEAGGTLLPSGAYSRPIRWSEHAGQEETR